MDLMNKFRTAPSGATPLLPPESPLSMPVQSLRTGPRAPRPAGGFAMPGWRRVLVFGATFGLTLLAAYQLWWVMRGGGLSTFEVGSLALFVGLFVWIAQSFVSAVVGFVLMVRGGHGDVALGDGPLPSPCERTALLVPTYNEDPERLLAGVRAIHESLAATGHGGAFDFFVLSDTTREDIRVRELAGFRALRARIGDHRHLFYRHRRHNIGRKAGNIAEWVRRFGAAYPHMLILDADSLMSGETLVRLAAAMERKPRVALIQTLPVVVGGSSIFARMQQFAGRVYGPPLVHGNAWWHGSEGNYWGHNAIIRTAAFAAHCGLPDLGGPRPFGGSVLSHDFVEAALLRRGGWAVHLAPGLAGSYEEGPPSLTDMLVRDRRWCQGNLQHGGVLPARGLHWVSRWHLLTGIGHYVTAPMWAMLMLLGVLMTMLNSGLRWDDMLLPGLAPSVYWQAPEGPQRFIMVFGLTMALLFGPKLLGLGLALSNPVMRRACGGTRRLLAGAVLETVLATLMAPVTMFVQARGVAEVLSGQDSGWESQRRDDGTLPLSGLVRRYAGATLCGVLFTAWSYAAAPSLTLWMSPVLLGLVLSMPIVALTAAPGPGRWLQRTGVFRTPEEHAPPAVLARAQALRTPAHEPLESWPATVPVHAPVLVHSVMMPLGRAPLPPMPPATLALVTATAAPGLDLPLAAAAVT